MHLARQLSSWDLEQQKEDWDEEALSGLECFEMQIWLRAPNFVGQILMRKDRKEIRSTERRNPSVWKSQRAAQKPESIEIRVGYVGKKTILVPHDEAKSNVWYSWALLH